jgi:tetratricopeptide (TPR) repeat protein
LIGRCYEDTNNFEKAAEAFEISAQAYQIEKERADSAIAVSRCLFKTGKQQKAFTRLMAEIGKIIDSEIVSKVYESLAALYDEAKDSELQAFALEKALESRPYDTELLSRLAYSYEKHFDTLSLLHYQALIQLQSDNTWALNQIGINYRRLQMPIRSTKSYQKAVGIKSTLLDSIFEATFATDNNLIATLAAANLAYLYLDTGLVEEASMILEKATQKKDVHPNVAHAISELKKREIAEAEIEKCSLKSASQQQRFIRSFAEAYFTEQTNCLNLFSGLWQLPNGVKVMITQTEERIKARYNPDQQKEREYFSGHTSNRAARIRFTSSYGELYGYLDRIDGYIYLSSDARQIHIMKLENKQHTVFTLIKID